MTTTVTVTAAARTSTNLADHTPLLWLIAARVAETVGGGATADELLGDVYRAADYLMRGYDGARAAVSSYLRRYAAHHALRLHLRERGDYDAGRGLEPTTGKPRGPRRRLHPADPHTIAATAQAPPQRVAEPVPDYWPAELSDREWLAVRLRFTGTRQRDLARALGAAGSGKSAGQSATNGLRKLRTAVNGGVDPCPNHRKRRKSATPSTRCSSASSKAA